MTFDPPPADPREDRRCELARIPKFRLIRMLQPLVITAHPLSTWTKDEIVASLLDREFPPPVRDESCPDCGVQPGQLHTRMCGARDSGQDAWPGMSAMLAAADGGE